MEFFSGNGGIGIESYVQERIEKKISAVRPAHIKKAGAENQRNAFFEAESKNGSSDFSSFNGG